VTKGKQGGTSNLREKRAPRGGELLDLGASTSLYLLGRDYGGEGWGALKKREDLRMEETKKLSEYGSKNMQVWIPIQRGLDGRGGNLAQ